MKIDGVSDGVTAGSYLLSILSFFIRAISAAGIGYESHPRSSDQEALRLKHSEKSEIFVHCMLLLSTLLSTLSSLLV
jgi:hypothetical protein